MLYALSRTLSASTCHGAKMGDTLPITSCLGVNAWISKGLLTRTWATLDPLITSTFARTRQNLYSSYRDRGAARTNGVV
jgi:hypothetical protein